MAVTAAQTRRRPTRQETRQRLLEAAEEVFAEHGIDAASVTDVAAAAGLTKGAVYSSFRSKGELVIALMEEHVFELQESAATLFEQAANADDALRETGALLVDAARTDDKWRRVMISYAMRDAGDAEIMSGLAERRLQLRAAVAELIGRLAERYGWRLAFTPEEAAVVVLALSNGFLVERQLAAEGVGDDLLGRVLASLRA